MLSLWLFSYCAAGAVLPLNHHHSKDGKLVSINMMQLDNKREFRYRPMPHVQHLLPGNRRWSQFRERGHNVLPVATLQHMEYSVPLFFGSKKQRFNMLPDSGSADLWVPSIDCPASDCFNHARYTATKKIVKNSLVQLTNMKSILEEDAPSDAKELPSFTVEYGSGTVDGSIVCDDIYVNDTRIHHCFGQVDRSGLASFYQTSTMDGVLGLSFKQLKGNAGAIFMEDFVNQTKQGYVFGFYYANAIENAANSRFFLGEYNGDCAAEPISFHPIVQPVWWEVEAKFSLYRPKKTLMHKAMQWIDDNLGRPLLSFARRKLSISEGRGASTLLDSGTSMMCIPSSILHQLNTELQNVLSENQFVSAKRLRTVLNNDISTLHIKMQDKTYKLTGSDMTACAVAFEGSAWESVQCTINAETAENCCPEVKGGCHILGMPFFRTHFVVFNMKSADGKGATVGIAVANHNSSSCKRLDDNEINFAQKKQRSSKKSQHRFTSRPHPRQPGEIPDEATSADTKEDFYTVASRSAIMENLIGPARAYVARRTRKQDASQENHDSTGSGLRGRLSPT